MRLFLLSCFVCSPSHRKLRSTVRVSTICTLTSTHSPPASSQQMQMFQSKAEISRAHQQFLALSEHLQTDGLKWLAGVVQKASEDSLNKYV